MTQSANLVREGGWRKRSGEEEKRKVIKEAQDLVRVTAGLGSPRRRLYRGSSYTIFLRSSVNTFLASAILSFFLAYWASGGVQKKVVELELERKVTSAHSG